MDRILLAVDSMPVGGMERQTLELLKGLRHNGRFSVLLAVLDHGGGLEREAVEASAGLLPIARKGRLDGTPALSLIWQTRQSAVRLIHAVGWMSGLAALPAAWGLGVPILNGSIRNAPLSLRRRDRVSRWCALRSDWIVGNSHAGLSAYGLNDHPRAQVIANGIDFTRFDGVTPATHNSPTICMVANFNALKDHATVIRALPAVRRVFSEAQLLLVGMDCGTLADSRALVERLGLSSAVRFIPDSSHPEPFIAASQVCVLASPSESFSNALLEYMALAKPVVATDTCGDSAVLIRDAQSGFLVPPNSPESFAARIIEVLNDPQAARRMGEAGRRCVQGFTVPRMVGEYEAIYDRLLATSPAVRA